MKEKASTSETSSNAIFTQKKMEAVCVYEGVEVQFSVNMIFIVELGLRRIRWEMRKKYSFAAITLPSMLRLSWFFRTVFFS